MTALERALVVYAEAKGYEVERQSRGHIEKWELLEQPIGFNFAFNRYRLRDPRNMHKVCDSLYAEYLPNIPEKSISEMVENLKKYKPAGFSCKSGLGKVSELLEANNVKIGINSDPNIIPNYDNFINDFVEEDLNKPKEEEFDVKAYVKSLVQTPEYLERCKEVDPIIEILEAYKRGEMIERKEKYSSYEWSELWKGHVWNFSDFDYRISPKQPEAIPATEEELEEVKSEPKPCFWIKDKKTGITWKLTEMGIGVMQDFYIFDKQTKTWQDWGSK